MPHFSRVSRLWTCLPLAVLLVHAAPAGAQRLQHVGRVPADRDAWPDLLRLSRAHAGPLVVIGGDAYLVPEACRPGGAVEAPEPEAEAEPGGPRCVPAPDGSGFQVTGGLRASRYWYYDGSTLRPVHAGFVSFASGPAPPAGPDGEPRVDPNQINSVFNRGTGAYRAGDHGAAQEAFARAGELDPHFRDAFFYRLLALERMERWESMIAPGERTLELDPLNQSAMLLLARAYNRTLAEEAPRAPAEREARRKRLLELRERMNGSPVYFSAGARLDPSCRLQGTLLGGVAPAGSPVSLMVALRDPSGEEIVHGVQVAAPARGATRELDVPLGECGAHGSRMRYWLMSAEG